ncbi:GntR family transcriptional regulator [Microbacterium azadirachtae]|uniref:GntR family transcriptional regulator n=1 Tax=Microbacterium azadirachtae TaxID=582680 RepID=UPI0021D4C5AC|nr:GntR family transcriptional regulator [Microbacterium azadirachtae]UXW86422.1 GntR family transcriptional regulator [Microbacterium azadirachtae]
MGNAASVELESARVVRLLRESILSGQRRSGDRLIERDIADELAVSRLPVREAIRQLLSEGLLTARPRSWAVVRRFTEDDVRDIAQVRDVLEVLVFELAAVRHDSEGLAKVEAALKREFAAAGMGDAAAAHTAGAEFHLVMAELAENATVNEILGMMRGRLLLLFREHDDLVGMAEDHARIFESFAARDTATLRLRVQRHLRAGTENALRKLAEYNAETAAIREQVAAERGAAERVDAESIPALEQIPVAGE